MSISRDLDRRVKHGHGHLTARPFDWYVRRNFVFSLRKAETIFDIERDNIFFNMKRKTMDKRQTLTCNAKVLMSF
jgi:hypothetical protein